MQAPPSPLRTKTLAKEILLESWIAIFLRDVRQLRLAKEYQLRLAQEYQFLVGSPIALPGLGFFSVGNHPATKHGQSRNDLRSGSVYLDSSLARICVLFIVVAVAEMRLQQYYSSRAFSWCTKETPKDYNDDVVVRSNTGLTLSHTTLKPPPHIRGSELHAQSAHCTL